jgi:hypothetical protein
MEDFGLEGRLSCDVCGISYPCHLGAWGHPNTKGMCSHCLEGTLTWAPRRMDVIYPAPTVLPVGVHIQEEDMP